MRNIWITARKCAGFLLAAVLVCGSTVPVYAETRTKIESVNLYIRSAIESGVSGGDVYVSTSDSSYRVGSVEILNEDDDWIGGMRPRVSVDLYANNGYYFGGTSKSMFRFSGDDASYVTARREDSQTTLVLTFKLDKLENGDLTVTGAVWDESDGKAVWDDNSNARYYQVKLYRGDASVTGTRTTEENYYEFAGDITRRGDYYFEVRAVGSGSEKGDWASSDSWYVSASEADDLSEGYSDGPGGGSTWGSNRGPGVAGGGYSQGANRGPGVTTGSGGHWCLDPYGWWYQYENNTYPYNCWQCIDGLWYCFNESGYIRYGWIPWENKWYYCGSDGALMANTRTPDGYYVGGDGVWIP